MSGFSVRVINTVIILILVGLWGILGEGVSARDRCVIEIDSRKHSIDGGEFAQVSGGCGWKVEGWVDEVGFKVITGDKVYNVRDGDVISEEVEGKQVSVEVRTVGSVRGDSEVEGEKKLGEVELGNVEERELEEKIESRGRTVMLNVQELKEIEPRIVDVGEGKFVASFIGDNGEEVRQEINKELAMELGGVDLVGEITEDKLVVEDVGEKEIILDEERVEKGSGVLKGVITGIVFALILGVIVVLIRSTEGSKYEG